MPKLGENIARCSECGRLFEYVPGKRLCADCAAAAAPAPMPKRPTNVPRAGAERPRPQPGQLRPMSANASEEERQFYRLRAIPRCVRCAVRPQNGGSQFCLSCQMELNNNLGTLADEIYPMEPAGGGAYATDVLAAVEEKRMRAPTNHINLVGGPMIKYGPKR